MNGYGGGGAIAVGAGQIAYTGVNALGMSLLAAGLMIGGLVLLRLASARRATKSQNS